MPGAGAELPAVGAAATWAAGALPSGWVFLPDNPGGQPLSSFMQHHLLCAKDHAFSCSAPVALQLKPVVAPGPVSWTAQPRRTVLQQNVRFAGDQLPCRLWMPTLQSKGTGPACRVCTGWVSSAPGAAAPGSGAGAGLRSTSLLAPLLSTASGIGERTPAMTSSVEITQTANRPEAPRQRRPHFSKVNLSCAAVWELGEPCGRESKSKSPWPSPTKR
mmetsp:Transcript_71506/g.220692  ORF Transcript_71506/g.220692 Transcript_71506/m.220692 type:complete len:217 (-) Transcript_71506:138-788(-)